MWCHSLPGLPKRVRHERFRIVDGRTHYIRWDERTTSGVCCMLVYMIIKAMRPLTIVGLSLMFLGPLVMLVRSFGVILFDDVYIQLGFGLMVFLFGWGIFVYSDNERKHLETIARLEEEQDGQLARLEKTHAELMRRVGQKDSGIVDRFKQSLPEIRKDFVGCNVDGLLADPKEPCSTGGREYRRFLQQTHSDKNRGCPKWADDVAKKCNAMKPK